MRSHHGRYVAWEFIGRSTHTRQHRYSWLTILIWWQPCRWSEVGHTTAEISLCQKDDFGTLMEGIDDHSSNMCLFVYCIPLDGRINHVMSCHALLYCCIVLYCPVLSCMVLLNCIITGNTHSISWNAAPAPSADFWMIQKKNPEDDWFHQWG